uniref:Uncharacterized protein n=1 Tax=viral metagenome TaxID=1070528 RepID=A0A6M3KLH8_9ZZZZ
MRIINTIILVLFLFGCIPGSQPLMYNEGNRYLDQSFELLPKSKFKPIIIILKEVKVYVFDDNPLLTKEGMKGKSFASTDNCIYVIGKRDASGKIMLQQNVLGYELQHLLNWKDDRIKNPDK